MPYDVVRTPHLLPYTSSQIPRTRLTWAISISSFVIGSLSIGFATMHLRIVAPSWIKLTMTLLSQRVSAPVQSIWTSGAVLLLNVVIDAAFALMLIVGGVKVLQGGANAPRFLVRCATLRAVAAFVGAVVTSSIQLHSLPGVPETVAKIRWILVRGALYSISITVASSLFLIILIKLQSARARSSERAIFIPERSNQQN